MKKDSACKHPEQHASHLCVLTTHLDKKALSRYTGNPCYVCANCGGRTHEGKNLCAPKRLKR